MREEQIKQKLTGMLETYNEIPCGSIEDYVLLRKQAIEELVAEEKMPGKIMSQARTATPATEQKRPIQKIQVPAKKEAVQILQETPEAPQNTVTKEQQPAVQKARTKYEALRNINDGWN